MSVRRYADALLSIAASALLAGLPAPQTFAAGTQLRVTARVLPTKEASAAQSTISVVEPNGSRHPIPLSAQEKQALTAKAGYVPATLLRLAPAPGVHVIEVDF